MSERSNIVAHRSCHEAQSAISDTCIYSYHNGPIGRHEGLSASPNEYQIDRGENNARNVKFVVDFIVVIKFINFEDLLVQKNIIMCLYTTESHRSNFKVQVTPPIKIYYNGLCRYLEKKKKMRSDVKVNECENHQMDNMIYSFSNPTFRVRVTKNIP